MKIQTIEYDADGKAIGFEEKKEAPKKKAPKAPGTGPGRPNHVQYSEWKQVSKKAIMPAIAEMLTTEMGQVSAIAADPSTLGARALISSVLETGVRSGSASVLGLFLSYVYGKPVDFDPKEDEMEMLMRANQMARTASSDVIEAVLREVQAERERLESESNKGVS